MTPRAFAVSGPNGSITINSIIQIDPTTWRVNFANHTAAGIYTLTVLPTVSDVAGNLLNQDRDATPGESTQDRYVLTYTLPPQPEVFTHVQVQSPFAMHQVLARG